MLSVSYSDRSSVSPSIRQQLLTKRPSETTEQNSMKLYRKLPWDIKIEQQNGQPTVLLHKTCLKLLSQIQ